MTTMINPVRFPVLRASGKLELLPRGYDAETGVTTVSPVFEPTPDLNSEQLGFGAGVLQAFEKEDGELPGAGAFKGFLHVLLPLLVIFQIASDGVGLEQDHGMKTLRDIEDLQGSFDAGDVGHGRIRTFSARAAKSSGQATGAVA